MKYETPLDQEALMAAIQVGYGMDVTRLTFVPHGEVGQHYLVSCADQQVYFLTLLGDNRLARLGASRLDFYLSLTHELYERGLFRQLAYPIRTRNGELKINFAGQPVILYNFIPGVNLMECPGAPVNLQEKMAKLITRLHNCTSEIQLEIPYVEKFKIPFEPVLSLGLETLEQLEFPDRPGKKALKDILLPNRNVILSLLDHLHMLAEEAAGFQPDLVLCHTDANLANLILGEDGELYLVDWEGAMLAPAEHDLFIFTGEGFPEFLRHYRLARPEVKLSAELFGFYFYRRNLEDLTDWIVRILDENTTDEQDQHDLNGIMQDCVSGWAFLEEGIRVVRRQLAGS